MQIELKEKEESLKTLELGDIVYCKVTEYYYHVSKTHNDSYMLIHIETGYYSNGTYSTLEELTEAIEDNNDYTVYPKSEYKLILIKKAEGEK